MSTKTKTKQQNKSGDRINDLHQQVTDRIVKAIEEGNLNKWIKSWSATGLPTNFTTNKAYRGINTMILWSEREEQDFRSNLWATYLQITKAGGTVNKGEKSTQILFQKRELLLDESKVDMETGEIEEPEERGYRWVIRTFSVFNIDQTDLRLEDFEKVNLKSGEQNEEIEKLINNIPVKKVFGGDKCAYYPIADHIRMPLVQSFKDIRVYYSIILHELTHWTGHQSRLNRFLRDGGANQMCSNQMYTKEELVAELGASFLCAHFGIEGELQHESYLDHWLKALKADPKYLYHVAGMAQTAVDCILRYLK